MATTKDSSFKVKAEADNPSVAAPEAGAMIFDKANGILRQGDGSEWKETLASPFNKIFWRDILGPLTGVRLDAGATRYSFDPYNGAIKFNADARYPNEVLVLHPQINHDWKVGTTCYPHLHWKQQSANIPNWLIAWKLVINGELDTLETDYSNFTFGVLQSHAFTYTSGVLNQISAFPSIDLSLANISSLLTIVFFRDTANASGEFAGADPSALVEYATDLDVHIEVDAPGSRQQYIK